MAWSWLSTDSRLSSDTAEAMNWKMFWYWLNVNVGALGAGLQQA